MKSSVLAAVLLAVVLAIGAILWLSRDHDSATALGPVHGAGAASATGEPTLGQDAAKAEDKLIAAQDASVPRVEASQPEAGTSVALHGLVRPAVCADDGPIEVFAVAEECGIERLFAALEREPKGGFTDMGGVPGVPIVGRATVGADLRFTLPVRTELKKVHVLLLGHYWFTPESTACSLEPGAKDPELSPECGGSIAGTILPPPGVEGALANTDDLVVHVKIALEGLSGGLADMRGVDRRAKVAGGRFEVRALNVHSGYTLSVEPERFAAAEATQKELVAGRESALRIQLQRGGTLRGVVRDPSGAALAGAKVEAQLKGRWFGFDNHTVRTAKSGDDGAFELPSVTPGSVILVANLKGFLTNEPKKVEVADGGLASGLDIELGKGGSIAGIVAWPDGKPASGVPVDVEFDKSQMYGLNALAAARGRDGHATSGADGRFTVTGLGTGPFTVRASALPDADKAALDKDAAKDKEARKHRARQDGVKPGPGELQLVLKPAVGLPGHVVDAAGQPVASFHVRAERVGKGLMGNFGEPSVDADVKDARGEFLLQIERDGEWKVSATADGFAPSDDVDVTIPRAASEPPLELKLVRGATVKGLVKNPSGAPFPGADVGISTGDPSWKRMISGVKTPHTKSDPEGHFVLDGVKPGQVAIVAEAKAWAKSLPLALDIAPGETTENVTLILREGGKLTGEIYNDGKPAAGMLVQATQMKAFEQKMGFSDAQGKFALEHLESGTWQVVAMPTGGAAGAGDKGEADKDAGDDPMALVSKMKMSSAEITEGQETHVVLGAAPTDPIAVRGRVTHAGEPYKGATLVFAGGGKQTLATMKMAQVGKDGTYAVTLDKPGDYDVTVQRVTGKPGEQSSVEFARTIPLAKEFVLDLEMPTARISGRVKNPEGEPASGVRVSMRPDASLEIGTMWGGAYQESSTDEDGRFDLQALRPGTYTLFVGGMPMMGMLGGDADFGREVRPNLKLAEGEWMHDVDFRLKKPGTVEVTVVDDRNEPVEGAAIFGRDEDGRLLEMFSGVTTNGAGVAKYSGLAPGRYTFSAKKAGLVSADSSKVSIEGNDLKTLRIALSTGTIVWIKVVDADEKVVKADIHVLDESGHEVGLMLGLADLMEMFGQGGYDAEERKVGPLSAGKYRVRAVRQGGVATEKPLSLSGQAERHVKLKFEK